MTWLIDLMKARNNKEYNNLLIIEGEPGTGKSAMGCSIGQHMDDYFGRKNLVFTKPEFYEALKHFKRGTIMWDEPGVYISHRKWLSEEQINIMQILQSFRYRKVNVLFCLPSAGYMDKVAREMCHFVINMADRGIGRVYRIMKTPYQSWTYTPFMGVLYSEMPTAMLWETFQTLHDSHIDEFIEKAEKKSMAFERKEALKVDRSLRRTRPLEEDVNMATAMLPELIDTSRPSDQGLINVNKMKKAFKDRMDIHLPHTRAYKLRDELLTRLHMNDDALLKQIKEKCGKS